jgi:hypothetical protein
MICAITLAIPGHGNGSLAGLGHVLCHHGCDDADRAEDGAIYLGILIAQLLCGLATVTSASRMLFAFSRDDGMPVGSKALATVSPKYRTPVTAIWTATVLCILYVVLAMSIKVGGTSIYVIVVNSTLVFLFLSFTIPLVAGSSPMAAEMADPRPLGDERGSLRLVTLLCGRGHGGDPVHRRRSAE